MPLQFELNSTLEQRTTEAARILKKYANRIPVIVERRLGDTSIPDIDRHKFLVPDDLTVGQFIYTIRKRIVLPPDKSLFFFVNNMIPATSDLMSQLYQQHCSPCGFLMMVYTGESTFGT